MASGEKRHGEKITGLRTSGFPIHTFVETGVDRMQEGGTNVCLCSRHKRLQNSHNHSHTEPGKTTAGVAQDELGESQATENFGIRNAKGREAASVIQETTESLHLSRSLGLQWLTDEAELGVTVSMRWERPSLTFGSVGPWRNTSST